MLCSGIIDLLLLIISVFDLAMLLTIPHVVQIYRRYGNVMHSDRFLYGVHELNVYKSALWLAQQVLSPLCLSCLLTCLLLVGQVTC